MGNTKGFQGVVGLKRGSQWGTPVLVGADCGIEILQDGIAAEVALIPNEQISGSCQMRAGDRGAEFHRGDLSLNAKFDSLALPWALAFGKAGTPTQQGSDSAWKHAFRIGNDLEGLFATLVLDYQIEVREYPSVKVSGFKFECSQGDQVAKLTFPLIASSLNRNTTAGLNRTSTIPGITMPTNRQRLLFSQMAVRLNDADGPALGPSDVQFVNGFTLEMDRKLKNDDVTTQLGYLIDEPLQDGFTEVTGSLSFSKYATDNIARFTEMLQKTRKKLDVAFTGPVANGATRYAQAFFLNDVQFESGQAQIGGPGLTPWTLNFKAHVVSAAPTGFDPTHTDACQMTLINTLASDPLA